MDGDSHVMSGTVQMWSDRRGAGVIRSPDVGGGVRVRSWAIEMVGYRTLVIGQNVEFLCVDAHEGKWPYEATWVRPIAEG